MLTENQKKRYHRHLIIPGFSEIEQEKIINASVLVIGAGGLGAPVLQYLCAAGIGNIGIVDNDIITISNLQRQVLFFEEEKGKSKVEIASERLRANNRECKIQVFNCLWDENNAEGIATNYDMILDCTDNYLSRLTTDAISLRLNIPWVYAAINGWEGQVSVFNTKGAKSYQEAFNLSAENIPEVDGPIGVIGVTPAVAGSLQAAEVLKLITNQGDVLTGRILHFSLKDNSFQVFDL